ncbi:MAG: putative hydrolase [Thermoanaerobacteraceae bacterium]|uniref:Polymerase/histidinol phosphatase N-terminal domain-containing protein n=1 Tax=Biomaibacter acetigenes TaxID=2316383 RepID=A0A3G2R7S5_9FIRM|nr:PHP domain-containing protein [Biomaibacter acetigenes]AYO31522.1 hypothetical protein D2962_13765 [Biomaibacter acetigenes]MDK2877869.1 putative hydrolase [Thermoanaerobacteraceae bacterium]MDN5312234.1 putative hydrolase [Thermoanaerobacteraceae bacterium]
MKYFDLHTHSIYSDGDASIEELKKMADEKGYGLGISDHIFCPPILETDDIKNYLDILDNYPVLKGVEANIGQDALLPDSILKRLDYVIASVHWLPYNGSILYLSEYFGYRAGHRDMYVQKYDKRYSENLLEICLKIIEKTFTSTRVDILGHPTVLPFYEDLIGSSFLEHWEDEVINLCIKHNVAIEISGLWKEPGKSFIKKAYNKGAFFSFGSDCHKIEEICDLDYPIKVVKEAGIPFERIYIPEGAS